MTRPEDSIEARPPTVAGSFYPDQPEKLRRLADELLEAPERRPERWAAAMVPHAGLRYSGHVAAAVLNRLEFPPTIIVIGPKHTRLGVEWAVAPHASWLIPGCQLDGDRALAEELCATIPGLELDAAAHRREHAIEVELPFLARLAPLGRVVGVALGAASWQDCAALAEGLAAVVKRQPEPPLLLISSDMNHFATDRENRRLDALALDAMQRLEPKHLYETVREYRISMCGVIPAVIVMETLRRLGGLRQAVQVAYATSAEVSGDTSRVVGYAGVLLN